MLFAQSHTLNQLFASLLQSAMDNRGEHIGAFETYMRLALRAQSQCRATLETLAVVKNPPSVAFVKQANIANGGPQQVNNGLARENEIPQNQLLEVSSERLDTRAAGTTIRVDQKLEAMEQVHGTTDARG
jgi:hypothetical protein